MHQPSLDCDQDTIKEIGQAISWSISKQDKKERETLFDENEGCEIKGDNLSIWIRNGSREVKMVWTPTDGKYILEKENRFNTEYSIV